MPFITVLKLGPIVSWMPSFLKSLGSALWSMSPLLCFFSCDAHRAFSWCSSGITHFSFHDSLKHSFWRFSLFPSSTMHSFLSNPTPNCQPKLHVFGYLTPKGEWEHWVPGIYWSKSLSSFWGYNKLGSLKAWSWSPHFNKLPSDCNAQLHSRYMVLQN